MTDLKSHIRTIADFPKPGIQYRDITPVLSDPFIFKAAIAAMCAPFADHPPSKIAGLDARGFIFGPAMAMTLGAGFVPIRKVGKLPYETLKQSYALEYGEATLEIHKDAVQPGERVLLVDDLIATGGTAMAGLSLLRQLGADVDAAIFLVELTYLGGGLSLRNDGLNVTSLIQYGG